MMSAIATPLPRSVRSASAGWLYRAACLLSLPALIPLAGALIVPYLHNMVPTGFVEYDMPAYLANGRGHFDHGFQLLYSNPYSGPDSPAIYFQPDIFLLGLMQQLGLNPGITFNCFELLALFFTAMMAARFYQEVVGSETTAKRIGFVCFFWGGGILTLAGLAFCLVTRHSLIYLWKYDPTYGWWMLNFGRNLVYPTEAYYHGVFLLSVLCLIRGRLALSLVFAALLCASHPFTGVTLILVLIAYSAVELLLRSGAVNLKFLLGAVVIAALDGYYYLIWLNRFPDHRVVQSQFEKAWLYPPKTIVLALLLVGCFAIWRLAGSSFRSFRDPRIRLFAVWFVAVIALTQHQLVMRPKQPIHFAHGYDWMALFFIGAPALVAALDFLLRIRSPWRRRVALTSLLALFLLDNAAWLVKAAVYNEYPVSLTKTESDTLHWLTRNLKSGDMVVCQDEMVSYLTSAYTPARSWQGHHSNTPLIDQRRNEVDQLFSQGRVLPEWKTAGVFYVSPLAWTPPPDLSLQRRYANSEFAIWSAQ